MRGHAHTQDKVNVYTVAEWYTPSLSKQGTSFIMEKISICTVCMDRLFYLRETLSANLIDNLDYPALEFVVLDYNSQDGLENWIRSSMMQYIDSGLLKYFRTTEPKYFSQSHSKNLVSNLASGDIICLLDADVYAGKDYARWVNGVFEEHGSNTIVTTIRSTYIPHRDLGGKLAFHKRCFTAVRGYDEAFNGYGFEDVDFAHRLELQGGNRVYIEEAEFLKYISHTHMERLYKDHLANTLEDIYVYDSDRKDSQLEVIYLSQDNTFQHVRFVFEPTLRSNQYVTCDGWMISREGWKKGTYQHGPDAIYCAYGEEVVPYVKLDEDSMAVSAGAPGFVWRRIAADPDYYMHLIMLCTGCQNRLFFNESVRKRTLVNQAGWGKGTTYLNFASEAHRIG